MGYRYTFVSEDIYFKFSNEFIDKHKGYINFNGENNNSLPISSKFEIKHTQTLMDEIEEEVKNSEMEHGFFMIFIGECGNNIIRRQFTKEGVFEMEEKVSDN